MHFSIKVKISRMFIALRTLKKPCVYNPSPYLRVVSTHGSRAAFRAPGVALVWVWKRVVLHLIVPGLDVVSRGTVPEVQDRESVKNLVENPVETLTHFLL